MSGIATVLGVLRRSGGVQARVLAVLVLLGGLLPTASILATGALVGSVPGAVASGLGSPRGRDLLLAVAAVAAVYVLTQTLAPVTGALGWSVGSRYVLALRDIVSSATLAPTGIAHLEDPEIADELAVVEGTEARPRVRQATVPALMGVTGSWLTGLGAAALLFAFRWWAPLVLGVAWACTHRWVGREVETFTKSLTSATPELRRAGYFRDLALRPAAAKEVRAFGLAPWLVGQYAREWAAGMAPIWRERKGHHTLMAQAVAAVALGNGLVFVALGRAAFAGDISLTELAVYGQAALGTMALGAQGDAHRVLREGAELARRAVALAGRIGTVGDVRPGSSPLPPGPESGIRFEGVTFAYPGTGRVVLDRLDLFVPAGRSLAVVGTNGAGKTTLIKLLTRLYEPTSGRITVDGVDLADVDPAVWLERVGVIFQDFLRFELSCRANVAVGATAPGDDEGLDAVAAEVGLDGVVGRFGAGWDTVLSRAYDGGTDLSGGEWQRVALARALYAVRRGASVLVLDEPTANLDVEAETELFDRVLASTRGTTTVLVSHRLSSVRRVDRIVVLDAGRVVEEGAHDELMAARGRYAAMFELQAARFREQVPADA